MIVNHVRPRRPYKTMDPETGPGIRRRPQHEGRGEVTSTQTSGRTEARPSIGELVSTLSEKLSTLIRDEIQLAKLELAEKAKHAGTGIGLFVVAGVLAFFGLGVLITTAILGLANAVPAWLAALIVALLAGTEWAEFAFVRDSAGLSDSTLSKRIAQLSDVGYVEVKKGYVGKRPRTWLNLSTAGRQALGDHIEALRRIAAARAPFISRGDRSGTHSAELALWKTSGVDIEKDKGSWYRSLGQGMGATLNTAAASGGYTLTDRATWINFKNKQDFAIIVEGDKRLFNQYGVMLVNPEKCPSVKKDLGQAFIDYLVSPQGQKDISSYKIDGQSLFFPNAEDHNA